MQLKKQVDKLIEIEYQLDKLYEKVSDAEFYGDKEELQKNLDYIRIVKEVEDEHIEKLKIDKKRFYEIIHLLNSDNYLQLILSINKKTHIPYYKVNINNINSVYCFLYHDKKYNNRKEEPNLNYFLCNTVNHPLMRRLFYKVMESYYKGIKNPAIAFDSFVVYIMEELIQSGNKELLIYARENAIALLYLDVHTQFESTFLAYTSKKEYQKDVYIKALFVELKRYISFSNPNLESYLLLKDECYINPIPVQLQEKYKQKNKKIYRKIREKIALTDMKELISFFEENMVYRQEQDTIFYKLYIKSRTNYLNDKQIYILINSILKQSNSTNIILELLEEEIKVRITERKEKKVKTL